MDFELGRKNESLGWTPVKEMWGFRNDNFNRYILLCKGGRVKADRL